MQNVVLSHECKIIVNQFDIFIINDILFNFEIIIFISF